MTSETTERRGTPAVLLIWLASLWVLAGACFKLFLGTPADLPEAVRSLSPLGLGLTYKLAISVELCLGFLGLLRPRIGWVPLVLLFLVFDAVLFLQIAADESNCGCFGSNVSVPPEAMLLIDSSLLAGILYSRPWRIRGWGAPMMVVGILLALGLVLPWVFDREASSTPAPAPGPDSVSVDGEEVEQPALRQWEVLERLRTYSATRPRAVNFTAFPRTFRRIWRTRR